MSLVGFNVDVNVKEPTEIRAARSYYEPVVAVGGTPLLIPPMPRRRLLRALDGIDRLVLIGGRDYSPERYGETPLDVPLNLLHDDRQEFDLLLTKCALARRIPILAICGGLQALNIALGGTLWQDIPAQYLGNPLVHKGNGGILAHHPVSLVPGSDLARIYGSLRLDSVVTSHHQSIKNPGKGLRIVATSDDGIIEAVELVGYPFVIGVQWHPERDFEGNKRLFRAFIRA